MLTGMIGSLVANGLPILGDKLTEVLKNEGVDVAEQWLKNTLGIDIDFNGNDVSDEEFNKVVKQMNVQLKEKELELKQHMMENTHQESLIKAGVELQKLDKEDRESARAMGAVYIASQDKFIARFIPIFAMILILTCFWVLMYPLMYPNEEANIAYLTAVSKTAESVILLVIGYFFGSSHSSSMKNDWVNKSETNGYDGYMDSDDFVPEKYRPSY